MNKIKAEINGHNLELWYHSTLGVLEAVYHPRTLLTSEPSRPLCLDFFSWSIACRPIIVETMYSGVEFSVRNETGPLSSMNVML